MRSRTRHILMIAVAAGLLAVFASGYGEPVRFMIGRIGDLRPIPVVVGVAVSMLAMWNRGWMNQVAHEAVGVRCGATEMTRTAAVGFAAQKVVKSAGAAGLAVFVRHGRRRGHQPGAVVVACVLTAVAAFLALGGLLAIAIGVLAATDRLTGWWIAAAVGFSLYAVVVIVGAVVVIRSRSTVSWAWDRVQRLRRRPPTPMPTGWFDALDVGCRRPTGLVRLVGHAVLGKLLGATVLTAALAATGLDVGPSDALIVYATALAASMVAIVPGGVGVVEGSLVALLVADGADAGPAALAVALFRVLDLWLPVLAGFIAARGELSNREPEVEVTPVVATHAVGAPHGAVPDIVPGPAPDASPGIAGAGRPIPALV